MLKLTTDKHEASRGLFVPAELLVLSDTLRIKFICDCDFVRLRASSQRDRAMLH